jgi:cytoplasmic iron level regulating protein YaaA (DUF328/UPF0246 family)
VPAKLPLILLPPSEGKAPGGRGPAWQPGTMAVDLDDRRLQLAEELRRAMTGSAAARGRLLGVKGEALAAATEANLAVRTSPTTPAIERYTGVLYGELDAASLPPAARRRLLRSVLVLSGLWGLVAPGDPIPDYKLKMGATLGGAGRLASWWREPLTDALAATARGRVVWNLLPSEHDAAWRPEQVPTRAHHTVRFLERRPDGSLRAVSHWNKLLKGALVRFLLEHPQAGVEDLAGWDHPLGYRLAPELTDQVGVATRLSFVQQDRA